MVKSSGCLIINSPTGYGVCGRGCCKSEVKDGGSCSILVVVYINILFVDKFEIVCVGPVDDRICAFGCFDIGVPPWMMGIEVTHCNCFFRKRDLADASFHCSFILVWCLGSFIVDVEEECR